MIRNTELLDTARRAYEGCADLRRRRLRYKRYTYGDQWSDPAAGDNSLTEGDEMVSRGYKPLSNNLIRQLVKCIIGRWRYRCRDGSGRPGGDADAVYDDNELDELDCRTLEEFLISGCAIQRIVRENRPLTGLRTYVDAVSPARFFVNATSDPRGRDIEIVGMLHDISFAEVLTRYGGSRARDNALTRIYSSWRRHDTMSVGASVCGDSFLYPASDRCRVIEVWTLECRERLLCHDMRRGRITVVSTSARNAVDAVNASRMARGEEPLAVRVERRAVWHGRFMAPDATVLAECDSPYAHGSHPFALRMYPLIDGEVHPLVEDVIDQQVYINRLITLLDRVMLTSAKGALLFPQNQIGDGIELSDVARLWAAPDSVIPYRPIPGQPEPHQLVTNATDIGARELLEVQMRLFEQISGVSDALQGRLSSTSTGAGLYDAQVQNALISVADLIESFGSFVRRRNLLLMV